MSEENPIPVLPTVILALVMLALLILRFAGQRRQPTVLLGVILGSVCLILAFRIVAEREDFLAVLLRVPVFAGLMLQGPAIYLYTRSSLFSEDWRVLMSSVRWGLWTAAAAGPALVLLMLHYEWLRDPKLIFATTGSAGLFVALTMTVFPAYVLGYVGRAWWILRDYQNRYEDTLSAGAPAIEVRWLRIFLALCTVWHLIPPVLAVLAQFGMALPSNPAVELPVALMVYFVLQHALNRPRQLRTALAASPPAEAGDGSQFDGIAEQILVFFHEDEAFLEAELSVERLAERLGLPAYVVSKAINASFRTNFFGLVNTFRVARAAELLRDPHLDGETVLNIAFRAGFNSKPAFNRVFRATTGSTPRDFRQNPRLAWVGPGWVRKKTTHFPNRVETGSA